MNLEEIRTANSRISDIIIPNTPLLRSHLDHSDVGDIYLKLENLQVTGSFKIRGAANKLTQLEKGLGIVTASAGNHGQAVALCAQKLGLKAKIAVPETTPKVKINKIRQYNQELILHGSIYDEAEDYAKELAISEGLSYVSPYNDSQIIAGQGTIALEILSQMNDVDAIVVPVGGGGLISGIGVAAKSIRPEIEVIGVQSEASPTMYESFLEGKLIDTKVEDSIADGLSGNLEHDSITFEIAKKYVDEMLLVKEKSIRDAIRFLWEKEGQIVEGSGAVPIAALIEKKIQKPKKKIVAVISGSNIDLERFKAILLSS